MSAQRLAALAQQGLALFQAGRLQEAADACRAALALDARHGASLHLLALLALGEDRARDAVALLRQALAAEPHAPLYHYNLGSALAKLGQLAEAEARYREAIRLEPRFTWAHNNLGTVLKDQGRRDEAEACYREALRLDPSYTEALHNLSLLTPQAGDWSAAIAAGQRAVAQAPHSAAAHHALGRILLAAGRHDQAFSVLRTAVRAEPQHAAAWSDLAACLATRAFHFDTVDDALLADLARLLEGPHGSDRVVQWNAVNALRRSAPFAGIQQEVASGRFGSSSVAEHLATMPILLHVMESGCVPFADLEAMLTSIRRQLLDGALAGTAGLAGARFLAALASLCFANGYVFSESDDEGKGVAALEAKIAAGTATAPLAAIVTLATYRPLHRFPWAPALPERAWPDDLIAVVRRQIREPLAERALREAMPHLTPIEGETSRAVRAQYEEDPYPSWVRPLVHPAAEPIDRALRQLSSPLDLRDYRSPAAPEMLIAGCGTGWHALEAATKFANARVLAIDLSLASLGYAQRKTRELKVTNIEYAQADILELGRLDRRFDLIESVGVLHHLQEPLTGWRVLVGLLRPGGLMRIGLYSEIARRGVVKARTLIAQQGYSPSLEGIRRCRQDLMAHAASDADFAQLIASPGFYSTGECRDLLFHVCEHRFTLPQIASALRELGLRFIGFEFPLPDTAASFRRENPDTSALYDLALWHAFEERNPDIFAGMYQFWCRKEEVHA